MEATTRLEVKIPVKGGEGSIIKSSDPSYFDVLYECISSSKKHLFGDKCTYATILVEKFQQ